MQLSYFKEFPLGHFILRERSIASIELAGRKVIYETRSEEDEEVVIVEAKGWSEVYQGQG